MGSSINVLDLTYAADGPDTDFQRRAVADLLGRDRLTFPGAQPVSFTRHHLKELREVDYFMCEKTDGIRYLLFLTQHIDPGGEMAEAQYLIDRKNEYYYVKKDTLHIPKSTEDLIGFHTGTLLDGELVRQREKSPPYNERLVYLIFDCLATDGENIMHRDFSQRLSRIDRRIIQPMKAFKRQYPDDVAHFPFQVEMKKMERPYGFVMMFDHVLPELPHGNDGLIFTCTDTFYQTGTDPHILKWKPPEENTVDFRLILDGFPKALDEKDGEEYEDFDAVPEVSLWVNYGGAYKTWATLHLTETEWEGFKSLNQQLDGRIIEAYRDAPLSDERNKEVWRPKLEKDGTPRFRDDKTDANHISTVESVLESIRDAVSEEQLKEAGYEIRKRFKERAVEKERREREERERERRRREAEKRKMEEERARRERAAREQQQQQAEDEGGQKQGEEQAPAPADIEEDEGPKYDED